MQLGELRNVEQEIVDLGYRIIAISADRPSKLRETIEKHELNYTLLSDSALVASRAFGIAFRLEPDLVKRYRGYGLDLEGAAGLDHGALPVPAVFLTDAEGTILFSYVNPTYQIRIPANLVLAAAREFAREEEER